MEEIKAYMKAKQTLGSAERMVRFQELAKSFGAVDPDTNTADAARAAKKASQGQSPPPPTRQTARVVPHPPPGPEDDVPF